MIQTILLKLIYTTTFVLKLEYKENIKTKVLAQEKQNAENARDVDVSFTKLGYLFVVVFSKFKISRHKSATCRIFFKSLM